MKTEAPPQQNWAVLMGLPIAMLALWPWGWQQNPMDQSDIIPRIYQFGSKEKAAEPLEARKCVRELLEAQVPTLWGKPFERLNYFGWKMQRPVKRDNEWVFQSDQLHYTLPLGIIIQNFHLFALGCLRVSGLLGKLTSLRGKNAATFGRTRTWHLVSARIFSLHHHPCDSLGHSSHL